MKLGKTMLTKLKIEFNMKKSFAAKNLMFRQLEEDHLGQSQVVSPRISQIGNKAPKMTRDYDKLGSRQENCFPLVTGGLDEETRMLKHEDWYNIAISETEPNFLKEVDENGKERALNFIDLIKFLHFTISFVPSGQVLKGLMVRCCELFDQKTEEIPWKIYLQSTLNPYESKRPYKTLNDDVKEDISKPLE